MIVIIDDEYYWIKDYLEALSLSGFEFQYFDNIDDAYQFIESNKEHISIIILDIMMPNKNRYRDYDTKDGLITGQIMLDDLKRELTGCYFLILTNVEEPDSPEIFIGDNIEYFKKEDTSPIDLVEAVKKIVT